MASYTVIYTGSGDPVVHATGCADIRRELRRADGGHEVIEGTLDDVAETAYADHIEEGSTTAEEARHALNIKPCARS